VDLSARRTTVKPSAELYADAITVPFLTTRTALARPTLMLLFTTPQWLPGMRLEPASVAGSSPLRPSGPPRELRSWFRILCVTSQVLFRPVYAPALGVAHAWDALDFDLGAWLLPIEAFSPSPW
jgi:hypothetical protein